MFFTCLFPDHEKPTTSSAGLAGIVNKVYLAEWKAVIYCMGTKNNDFKKMNYCSWFRRLFVPRDSLYDGLYPTGMLPPKGVHSFFRPQVYQRVRDFTSCSILKSREICHLGLEKGPKRLTFYGFKTSETFYFVINSYSKDGAFTAVKRKGYLFREKWYIKGKRLDLGVEPPGINICWVTPPPPGFSCCTGLRGIDLFSLYGLFSH